MKDNKQAIKSGSIVKFKAGVDDREYQVISVLNDTDGEKLHLALFPLNKFTRIDDVELVSDTNNSGDEKEKPNMKPFDLEKALAGAQVVTRDGQTVSELHHFKTIPDNYKLVVVVDGNFINCTESGKYLIGKDCGYDLFMRPVKQTGYINLYRDVSNSIKDTYSSTIYLNESEANKSRAKEGEDGLLFLKCVKVEWEE